MAELNFYRGIKAKYSKEEHKDGIYFATDKHEIILNGSTYGLEIDDELLSNSTNPATGRAISLHVGYAPLEHVRLCR